LYHAHTQAHPIKRPLTTTVLHVAHHNTIIIFHVLLLIALLHIITDFALHKVDKLYVGYSA